MQKWGELTDEEKIPYEKKSRDHLAKQDLMKDAIVDALRKEKGGNCSRSFGSLTGDWCRKVTIVNWLKSQPDFCLYTKLIRPEIDGT